MIKASSVEHTAQPTRTAYSRTNTFLDANHLQLLRNSAISPEISEARGYRTITERHALKGFGFGPEQCRPPALLIPIYNSSGRLVTYQMRPDEPRIHRLAGAIEYEVCPGRRFALDAPPSCASLLSDPETPLYITDEVFKADSAASQGLCCIDPVGLLSPLEEGEVERRLPAIGRASFWTIGWSDSSMTPIQRIDRKRGAPSRLCRNFSGRSMPESSASTSDCGI
jgi:hypothetical protein